MTIAYSRNRFDKVGSEKSTRVRRTGGNGAKMRKHFCAVGKRFVGLRQLCIARVFSSPTNQKTRLVLIMYFSETRQHLKLCSGAQHSVRELSDHPQGWCVMFLTGM